ncbi:unnamed protein product, partial [Closterium sp. NIES-53]
MMATSHDATAASAPPRQPSLPLAGANSPLRPSHVGAAAAGAAHTFSPPLSARHSAPHHARHPPPPSNLPQLSCASSSVSSSLPRSALSSPASSALHLPAIPSLQSLPSLRSLSSFSSAHTCAGCSCAGCAGGSAAGGTRSPSDGGEVRWYFSKGHLVKGGERTAMGGGGVGGGGGGRYAQHKGVGARGKGGSQWDGWSEHMRPYGVVLYACCALMLSHNFLSSLPPPPLLSLTLCVSTCGPFHPLPRVFHAAPHLTTLCPHPIPPHPCTPRHAPPHQREEELLTLWWKEYADAAVGPAPGGVLPLVAPLLSSDRIRPWQIAAPLRSKRRRRGGWGRGREREEERQEREMEMEREREREREREMARERMREWRRQEARRHEGGLEKGEGLWTDVREEGAEGEGGREAEEAERKSSERGVWDSDNSGDAGRQGDGEGEGDGEESEGESEEGEEEPMGVTVKGGLYEVDLGRRRSYAVYWEGEDRRVLRGLWFGKGKAQLTWQPLREDVAEQLEEAYRKRVWRRRWFLPSGLFASRVPIAGAGEGVSAVFTGDDSSWRAQLWVEGARLFSSPLHAMAVRRGFPPPPPIPAAHEDEQQVKEEELDDYCSMVPVQHVVFMVHGVGQRLESAHLVDDVTAFRHHAAQLSHSHLTAHQRLQQRCLFIPCQWRRGMALASEAVVEGITLEGVRALRDAVSATVHDVLYYMSPAYCQTIIHSLTSSLNRLYRKFKRRNPLFNGRVSVFGHSLGSVLLHDILCHQPPLPPLLPPPLLADGRDQGAMQGGVGKAGDDGGWEDGEGWSECEGAESPVAVSVLEPPMVAARGGDLPALEFVCDVAPAPVAVPEPAAQPEASADAPVPLDGPTPVLLRPLPAITAASPAMPQGPTHSSDDGSSHWGAGCMPVRSGAMDGAGGEEGIEAGAEGEREGGAVAEQGRGWEEEERVQGGGRSDGQSEAGGATGADTETAEQLRHKSSHPLALNTSPPSLPTIPFTITLFSVPPCPPQLGELQREVDAWRATFHHLASSLSHVPAARPASPSPCLRHTAPACHHASPPSRASQPLHPPASTLPLLALPPSPPLLLPTPPTSPVPPAPSADCPPTSQATSPATPPVPPTSPPLPAVPLPCPATNPSLGVSSRATASSPHAAPADSACVVGAGDVLRGDGGVASIGSRAEAGGSEQVAGASEKAKVGEGVGVGACGGEGQGGRKRKGGGGKEGGGSGVGRGGGVSRRGVGAMEEAAARGKSKERRGREVGETRRRRRRRRVEEKEKFAASAAADAHDVAGAGASGEQQGCEARMGRGADAVARDEGGEGMGGAVGEAQCEAGAQAEAEAGVEAGGMVEVASNGGGVGSCGGNGQGCEERRECDERSREGSGDENGSEWGVVCAHVAVVVATEEGDGPCAGEERGEGSGKGSGEGREHGREGLHRDATTDGDARGVSGAVVSYELEGRGGDGSAEGSAEGIGGASGSVESDGEARLGWGETREGGEEDGRAVVDGGTAREGLGWSVSESVGDRNGREGRAGEEGAHVKEGVGERGGERAEIFGEEGAAGMGTGRSAAGAAGGRDGFRAQGRGGERAASQRAPPRQHAPSIRYGRLLFPVSCSPLPPPCFLPLSSSSFLPSPSHHPPSTTHSFPPPPPSTRPQVDTFFAVGSPLGLFLALRNIRLGDGGGESAQYWGMEGVQEELPACRHVLNIFHPHDPVAYRLEPLVSPQLASVPPVLMPYHRGRYRTHIVVKRFLQQLRGSLRWLYHALVSRLQYLVRSAWSLLCFATPPARPAPAADSREMPVLDARSQHTLSLLTGSPHGRIDFMLQDPSFQHQYLQAMSCH